MKYILFLLLAGACTQSKAQNLLTLNMARGAEKNSGNASGTHGTTADVTARPEELSHNNPLANTIPAAENETADATKTIITVTPPGMQYQFIKKIFTTTISKDDAPVGKVAYAGYDHWMHIYVKSDDASGHKIIVNKLDLSTGLTTEKDTFDIPDFSITDALATPDYDMLIGNDRIFFCGRKEGVPFSKFTHDDKASFARAQKLNDSLVLLYFIYDYHPSDGTCGLHLNTYNVKTQQIVKSKLYHYPGVALSAMAANWVTVNDGKIYAFTPLSNQYFIYNQDLQQVGTDSLDEPLFNKLSVDNREYAAKLDATTYREWSRINKIIERYGKDSVHKNYSLITSDVFGKEFISNTLQETRANHSYIEHVFNIGKDTVAITVARPDYNRTYRDVYLVKLSTKKLVKTYTKWLAGRENECKKIEDFFSADLVNSSYCETYFYNNRLYTHNFYDPGLYHNGSKDSLSKEMLQSVLKSGYKWTLSEYSF